MEQIPKIPEISKKEEFFSFLKEEVQALVLAGRLTEEQANEKIDAASKIEDNIPDDTRNAAKLFAILGIANEEELVAHFNK